MNDLFFVNGRFLTQKLTGVHRYAFEMCCALKEIGCNFIVLSPQNILSDYSCSFEVRKIGKRSSHFWEQIELPLYLRKNYKNSLLVNFTGLGSILHKRFITTIHDVSFLINPKWFSRFYYLWYKNITPIVARKSLKIITVSNFSKNELISRLNISPAKIEVVYNAVSEKIACEQNNLDLSQKGNYILTVSSLDPRKNFIRLIEAFHLINQKNYKLYIVGKRDKVFTAQNYEKLNQSNIMFLGYVSDEELSHLYQNATIFVYPSLYEGFGIPNLEAMTNSCPVVTSNIPPHIEICQDAAVYFDPEDVNDIASKMEMVINDLSLRQKLIENGKIRAKDFSWKKSAEKLMQIINSEMKQH